MDRQNYNNVFFLIIILYTLMTCCNCETMDEIIRKANEESRNTRKAQLPDGKRILEYDMMLTERQYPYILSPSNRKRRKAIEGMVYRWADATIPYHIDNTFSADDVGQIQEAIQEWERHTCLKFRIYNPDRDRHRVIFSTARGCWSNVGRLSDEEGPNEISLGAGCRLAKVIIHEIGHTIGFWHEQSRPDRENHIRIVWENIQFDKHNEFKINSKTDTYDVPYDYQSIMHYGQFFYSLQKDVLKTIVTTDNTFQDLIGNATRLSFKDIKLANVMYSCGAHCQNPPTCPSDGFLSKDCTCLCPGNPTKKCNMCTWQQWGQWGYCTRLCDGGTRARFTYPTSGSQCSSARKQGTQSCNVEPCPTCNKNFETSTGIFLSPNHPRNYPNMMDCKWTIQIPTGKILLTFSVFELEICPYDYVDVHDGRNQSASQVGHFCGYGLPQPVTSTANSMLILFHSDGFVTEPGFEASFKRKPECRTTPWSAWNPCTKTCGKGEKTRYHYSFGTGCHSKKQTVACNTHNCPVCRLADWSSWRPCSVSCGGGIQKRYRYSTSGSDCPSSALEEPRPCNTEPCPEYTDWSPWTTCDRTCGNGVRYRTRTCTTVCSDIVKLDRKTCKQQDCIFLAGEGTLLSCDFETVCKDLDISRGSDDYDWERIRCCTPSEYTGPAGDHTLANTTGYFMYAEATNKEENDYARMRNKVPFKHIFQHVCVRFWYHMKGGHMGELSVFYLDESQVRTAWSIRGNQGEAWKKQSIDVNTSPNQRFWIEFEAVRGKGYKSDICIDDILITSGSCHTS